MHGYNPDYINMYGIFYAIGLNFKSDLQIETFENVQIYPLLCNIFKINEFKQSEFFNDLMIKKILK